LFLVFRVHYFHGFCVTVLQVAKIRFAAVFFKQEAVSHKLHYVRLVGFLRGKSAFLFHRNISMSSFEYQIRDACKKIPLREKRFFWFFSIISINYLRFIQFFLHPGFSEKIKNNNSNQNCEQQKTKSKQHQNKV